MKYESLALIKLFSFKWRIQKAVIHKRNYTVFICILKKIASDLDNIKFLQFVIKRIVMYNITTERVDKCNRNRLRNKNNRSETDR